MLFVPYSNVGVRLTPKKGYIMTSITALIITLLLIIVVGNTVGIDSLRD